ncbi:hypothetical protein KOY48_02330 [Candidatus Minimicrobia naudis]|uniref:Uncharacterized protein n=1 Tax=Candidatus Minimicrobia naudis TaxID=2841263 RepID=A0A8F1SBV1_9BACT|nr:hypothetical protein KOY48_02330 [Candidatus Minimicrobia naudis]
MNRSFYVGMTMSLTLADSGVIRTALGEILHIHEVDIAHIVVVSLLVLTIPIVTSEIQLNGGWDGKLAGRVL